MGMGLSKVKKPKNVHNIIHTFDTIRVNNSHNTHLQKNIMRKKLTVTMNLVKYNFLMTNCMFIELC